MVKVHQRFECAGCGDTFETEAEALACEAQPFPAPLVKVGEFVGWGTHGWWNADMSWTAWMRQRDGEMHSPPSSRKWRPGSTAPPGPTSYAVGGSWFLPIWRVVATRDVSLRHGEPGSRHATEWAIWTPRHANVNGGAGGERIVGTKGLARMRLPPRFRPALTDAEKARYVELVEDLRRPERWSEVARYAAY